MFYNYVKWKLLMIMDTNCYPNENKTQMRTKLHLKEPGAPSIVVRLGRMPHTIKFV